MSVNCGRFLVFSSAFGLILLGQDASRVIAACPEYVVGVRVVFVFGVACLGCLGAMGVAAVWQGGRDE